MIVPGTRISRHARRIAAAVATVALLAGLGISAIPRTSTGGAASVAHSDPKTSKQSPQTTTPTKVATPIAMTAHPVKNYVGAAARLPAGLTKALGRDSGLTGAEWLANSAAAIEAVKVVAGLSARGVDVLGSRMDGTKLTVNVASGADLAAVRAVGATAVIGAPKVKDFTKIKFTALATNIYGGQGYFYSSTKGGVDGDGYRCSIGFNGYAVSTGAAQFATAGHCATAIPSGNVTQLVGQAGPAAYVGDQTLDLVASLGAAVSGEGSYGSDNDYGIIADTNTSTHLPASIATWGGGAGAAVSTRAATYSTLAITGETAGIVNATMCKSGSSSGWTCGKIEAVDQVDNVSNKLVNSIVASTCLLGGDSGGAAVIGSYAVGIDSGGDNAEADDYDPSSCTNATDSNGDPAFSVFFPMVSSSTAASAHSVQNQVGSKWQLALTMSTPVVTSPAAGQSAHTFSSISGTLANPSPNSEVKLYIDGSTTATATAAADSTVSALTASWALPLSGVAPGTHTYSIVASSGYSIGTPVTGSISVPVQMGDFNSDGHPDVIARDSSGELWLYPGSGTGTLLPRVSLGAASGAFASATAIIPVGDFDNSETADVILRDASGTLWLYPDNGSNGFGTPVQVATGFGAMTAIEGVGDFTGDGNVDLVARDASGVLWLYPGNGSGGLGTRVQLASGWQGMSAILGVGDFTGDGHPDLIARDSSGALWLYPGTGSALRARISLGSGWTGYTLAAGGDFNEDSVGDIVARDAQGVLWLYPGNGSNGFLSRVRLASSFTNYVIAGDGSTISSSAAVSSSLSVGVDFNGDGDRDLIFRDSSGTLWQDDGDGATGFTSTSKIAAGWQGLSEITPVGDLNGDGNADVVARDSAGNLWLYPGNGAGGLGTRIRIGSGWQSMTALQGVGDFDGDGNDDLVARDASGNVWLYPGNGAGALRTRMELAANWQVMTAIVGVGDFTRDGHPDLVARDSAGTLWLYPGTGSDSLAARISLGAGWSGYTIVAAGDFDGDGNQDLIARDAAGVLWLYRGNGSNGWLGRTQLGSGFAADTLAGAG